MFDTDWFEPGWLRIEELREGDDLIVRAELPGIDPDTDVEITVAGEILHIRAKREEKSEINKAGGYRSEFRYGAFERDIALPPGVDPGVVEATYNDGILIVKVPMPTEKEETHRVIPVTTSK
jgi:HSP20 family protein